jgi:hypothetical protein
MHKPVSKNKIAWEAPAKMVEVSELPLAGYLLPIPVMTVVQENIETLALQEILTKKDKEFKAYFTN